MKQLENNQHKKAVELFEQKQDVYYPQLLRHRMLKENGFYWGGYSFFEIDDKGDLKMPERSVAKAPQGFVLIAQNEQGRGLMLHTNQDGIVYQSDRGDLGVYAESEELLALKLERDEVWEQLSENMPILKTYAVDILVYSLNKSGELKVLGFADQGESREHRFVVRGMSEIEEMLSDTLERELEGAFGITEFRLKEFEDTDEFREENGEQIPVFQARVMVEYFDPATYPSLPLTWLKAEEGEDA